MGWCWCTAGVNNTRFLKPKSQSKYIDVYDPSPRLMDKPCPNIEIREKRLTEQFTRKDWQSVLKFKQKHNIRCRYKRSEPVVAAGWELSGLVSLDDWEVSVAFSSVWGLLVAKKQETFKHVHQNNHNTISHPYYTLPWHSGSLSAQNA